MSKLKTIWLNILLFFVLLSVIPGVAHAAPPANFQTEQIITDGLDGPSGFEIAPDGRIFILQRTGEIKVFKNGVLLEENFAVLPSAASGDRGLIGIAFDPEFGVANHFVYFYYTGLDKINRLVRYDASQDVGQNGPFLIYQTNFLSENLHVGGSIRFGPDGKMYFAVGDNGYPPNAQDLSNPHGKILRINKDGSIPLDNPFYGQPGALPEIWAYGLRNPWRFQFDSVTGKLYGGDVGDFTWEEVNHLQKGKNYGWPNLEGYCYALCGTTLTPIYTYPHDGESAAVTGGPVYRATLFPEEYQGSLFFGDYAKGFIKRLTLDELGNSTGVHDFDVNAGSVVDLKVAPDGSLYYITYWPGRLYKISYTLGNHVPIANATADDPDGVEPHTVNFSSAGSYDPDDDPLTYFWEFGDGTTSTDPNPTKIYTVQGAYAVELSVSDGTHTAHAVPVVVQVGLPPTVTINEPADGSNYRSGDEIHYTAFALDGAGFDINDSDISTVVLLHHHTHVHPFVGPIIGRQGTFTIPTTGEASADTWFEIKTTATDDNGLSTAKSINIYPITSTFTLQTEPAGLQISLDGVPKIGTQTIEGVVGFEREVNAPATQIFNNKLYEFDHWSDNLPKKHFITTQEAIATYSAYFTELPSYNAEYFDNQNLIGPPVITQLDPVINFDWGGGSPDPDLPDDQFSARWTKTDNFDADNYEFSITADDGVRVKLDGEVIIDAWTEQSQVTHKVQKNLTAGDHTIVVEYFENGGGAMVKFNYAKKVATPYTASYFNNKTLSGAPALTRDETEINFDWGGGSPDPVVNIDNFSARWTKSVDLMAGEYEFTATGDDGIRLYVDNQLIIDKWIDQSPTTYTANKTLTAGTHTIRFEYFENGGGAVAKMSYVQLTAPTPTAYNAEYFNNKTLTAPAVITRQDADINFDWGGSSPDTLITIDNFSARWTKTETFTAGTYEFSAIADDGVRVMVDGEMIIDKWINQSPTTHTASKTLTAGDHTIVMEYFEDGGGAVAKLSYTQTSTPPPTAEYSAQYFNNKTLTAPATLTRNDAAINFDWGGASPDASIQIDDFSARWTKTETFTAGTYEFTVTADDGVRVKIDNELILDKWFNQSPTTYIILKNLTSGDHTIVVEYFESGGGAVAKMSYVQTSTPPPPTDPYSAEYFNNKTLTAPAVLTRNDSEINFDWGVGSPDVSVANENFSARWTKTHTFEDGTYKFTTISDDGIRVYVDNQLVIDQWNDHSPLTHTGEKTLTAGDHVIKVEYYESGVDAVAKFSFEKLTNAPPPPSTETFTAEFFNTMDLSGPVVLTRQYPQISFNWGGGSPDPLINLNNFSARFIKQKQFAAGNYTFTVTADDGVRFYIDDQLLINQWIDQPATAYTTNITLTEGLHTLKVEYYENGGGAVLTLQE